MKTLTVAGCAAVIGAAAVSTSAMGQSVVPAQSIARSGQGAVGVAGETFVGFGIADDFAMNPTSGPCIGADGSVVFAGYTSAGKQGLWANYSGQVVRLMVQGQPLVTSHGTITPGSLGDPAVRPLPVWKGYLAGLVRPTTNTSDTMAVVRIDGSSARVLAANVNIALQAGVQRCSFVSDMGADDDGRVTVLAGWLDSGLCVRTVSNGLSGVNTGVMCNLDPAPGFPNGARVTLSGQLLVGKNGRMVVGGRPFNSSSSALWLAGAGAPALLVRGNAVMPGWFPNTGFVNDNSYVQRGKISINASGLAVFAGAVNTNQGRRDGIWFGTELLVLPVIAESVAMGCVGEGFTMGTPRLPRINDWNEMAYVGTVRSPSGEMSKGVFAGRVEQWTCAARIGASAPGVEEGAVFTEIEEAPGLRINNQGQTVFMATARDGTGRHTQGLWVHDPLVGVRRVVGQGDVLATQTGQTAPVSYVIFTGDPVGDVRQTGLNDAGILVFAAEHEDGSAGVYKVDLGRALRRADLTRDGFMSIADVYAYLNMFFEYNERADLDGSLRVDVDDLFRYLELFFQGV